MVTGAAARRGHAAIRGSLRQTHLYEVTAQEATAQRAVTVCSNLVDADTDVKRTARPAMLRASEELDALGTGSTCLGMMPGGFSGPQTAPGPQPG
jgi:hypothetical protein